MPEAAVDENRQLAAAVDDVGLARQIGAVEPVAGRDSAQDGARTARSAHSVSRDLTARMVAERSGEVTRAFARRGRRRGGRLGPDERQKQASLKNRTTGTATPSPRDGRRRSRVRAIDRSSGSPISRAASRGPISRVRDFRPRFRSQIAGSIRRPACAGSRRDHRNALPPERGRRPPSGRVRRNSAADPARAGARAIASSRREAGDNAASSAASVQERCQAHRPVRRRGRSTSERLTRGGSAARATTASRAARRGQQARRRAAGPGWRAAGAVGAISSGGGATFDRARRRTRAAATAGGMRSVDRMSAPDAIAEAGKRA